MKVTNLSSNVAALVVFLLSGKIVIMLGIHGSTRIQSTNLFLHRRTVEINVPVAFYVLRKKNMDEKGGEIARKKQILLCAVCSLAVGCYDGFYVQELRPKDKQAGRSVLPRLLQHLQIRQEIQVGKRSEMYRLSAA